MGGTICTELTSHGTLKPSDKAQDFLLDGIDTADTEIVMGENLGVLSENITLDTWNTIVARLREYIKKDRYDGVIVAHGTDTLALTSSLFSLLFAGWDTPVFLVSSNAPLFSERANGRDNLNFALDLIRGGIVPSVWVPYKNISDGRLYLHHASRLEMCRGYSEDFYSRGALDAKTLGSRLFEEAEKRFPKALAEPLIFNENLHLSARVLLLPAVIGQRYDAFSLDGFSAVLHTAYHSGTVCVGDGEEWGEESVRFLADRCFEKGISLYITPSFTTGGVYDSIRVLEKDTNGVKFLYGTTVETSYVKLILAYSLFDNEREALAFIKREINHENFEEEL